MDRTCQYQDSLADMPAASLRQGKNEFVFEDEILSILHWVSR